ncbi:hypothetical protein [Micromonospora sp. NBC_01796]|uniref:hypothetical protein n=1 Tax=Micromonospora sp. NBC_01796 TaxID=2975987 RepID=UPI002DDA27A8|nr:hypothetical protein [Micromonospora sp. NBC_01796]WSA89601.1 hypothetical protein OIE47_19410 [Micromonospora sp. NBC_01796]
MTGVESLPPAPSEEPPPRSPRRGPLLVVVIGICLAVVIGTGYLIVTLAGPGRDGPLVLDQPNTVLWGQTINRPVEIAADHVTLRRITIRAGGAAAVRIRDGVRNTVIEDTRIDCADNRTDGIVPGGYSAVRVRVDGCRQAFEQRADAPATILDSTANGRPFAREERKPATVAPSPMDFGTDPPAAGESVTGAPTPMSYWPGPDTTGVPAGTVLRPSSSLDLREPGVVISNLDITGCVTVRAKNVTIRNSRITCDSATFSIRTYDTASDLVVENVEINGMGKNSAAVCCANYTLRRVNIHHVIDGPRLSANTAIIDSWIHDLSRVPDSHNDTLQTTGGSNIVVRHNRLEPHDPNTKDPSNACIMIGSTTSDSVNNLLVEENYCNGGNYSIGVRDDLVGSNIVIRGNRFGRDFRFGVIARSEQAGITWDRGSNVWFDSGQPVVR